MRALLVFSLLLSVSCEVEGGEGGGHPLGDGAQIVKSQNSKSGDDLGFSVAVDGDTMIAGAPGNASPQAFVFVRSGDTWIEQARLTANTASEPDEYGSSVAVSGDIAVVGAPSQSRRARNGLPSRLFAGAAYVYRRTGTSWVQEAQLEPSNAAANVDFFGSSVAASGDTVLVSGHGEDAAAGAPPSDTSAASSGAVYVFVRDGGAWNEQARLKASNADAGDFFGLSVSIAGDTAVVGAPYEDSASGAEASDDSAESAGAAYVFTRSGSTWTEQALLKASDADAGDSFGYRVSICGDTVAIACEQRGAELGRWLRLYAQRKRLGRRSEAQAEQRERRRRVRKIDRRVR
jgi:hypothetical protein